jgi:hypothetical protein
VKTARSLAVVGLMLGMLLVPALAFADGWSMPNLNPFSGKSSSKSKNDWSLTGKKPNSSFASSKSKKPSTWKKMSTGTANAWNKTTSSLNPWKPEPKKTPARPTGARRPPTGKATPKSTWYNPTSWFSKAEDAPAEKREAESVAEFLSQPRVPY